MIKLNVLNQQRQVLQRILNPSVIIRLGQRESSSSNSGGGSSSRKKKNATETTTAVSNARASKQQVRKIKQLHQENKALFGTLIESKQDKLKRLRQEVKLLKPLTSASKRKQDDEVTQTLNPQNAPAKPRKKNPYSYGISYLISPRSLPRVVSVKIEQAGVSINKNRAIKQEEACKAKLVGRRAHKDAEIEWTMKNAPTNMRLIESPSTSKTGDHDHVDGQGQSPTRSTAASSATSLPIEQNAPRKRVESSVDDDLRASSPSTAEESLLLPTAEQQLINSFYETGQNEERKMGLSDTKSFSRDEGGGGGFGGGSSKEAFNELQPPQKHKTENETVAALLLPYYNPNRTSFDEEEESDAPAAEENDGGLTTIITSYPFPFYNSNAAAAVDNNNNDELTRKKKPEPRLPSVSKILSATMPEEQAQALKRWEQRMIAQMGEQGFRQYKEGILSNGKSLHSNIESYLRGTPQDEIIVAQPNQGHWNSLNAVLASVEHVHVLESHVVHPQLQYCGVIDCVAEFRNRLVLIDWKTSQKPKPLVSMTYDTPLQIAAYIGAINYDDRYSLKINDGLIVIAYEDGSSCETFLLGEGQVEKYWKLWLKRLQLYRKLNPSL